jgi:glutamine amidotransferase
MAEVVAVLQTDPTLLRCQLHRLDHAIDVTAASGDAVGVGYYENGRVLLRKRPLVTPPVTLESLGAEIKTDLFFASWHRIDSHGFREEATAPFRFRNWLFAGKGKLDSDGEQAELIAKLPEFLQRAVAQTTEAELAFFTALAHVHTSGHQLDHLEIDTKVVADALGTTLAELDHRADARGSPRPQTTAMMSNGRMIVAVRRGKPLFYGLLEGMSECAVCGIEKDASDRDLRVRAHRNAKAVAVSTQGKSNGIQWIEVPDGHVVSINRALEARVTPLPG